MDGGTEERGKGRGARLCRGGSTLWGHEMRTSAVNIGFSAAVSASHHHQRANRYQFPFDSRLYDTVVTMRWLCPSGNICNGIGPGHFPWRLVFSPTGNRNPHSAHIPIGPKFIFMISSQERMLAITETNIPFLVGTSDRLLNVNPWLREITLGAGQKSSSRAPWDRLTGTQGPDSHVNYVSHFVILCLGLKMPALDMRQGGGFVRREPLQVNLVVYREKSRH